MKIPPLPFETATWAEVPVEERSAERGTALWRTRRFGDIRVRLVEYSAGYVSDHWCEKGHVLFCVSGSLRTELKDGRTFELTPGMSYHVGDGAEPHRSSTETGATLFVVD